MAKCQVLYRAWVNSFSKFHPGWKRLSCLSIWCCLPGHCQHLQNHHFIQSLALPVPMPSSCGAGSTRRENLCPVCASVSQPLGQHLAAVCRLQGKMSLEQEVPKGAHGQSLQCIEIFSLLEWADGGFLIPPTKKLMVRSCLRISPKLSLAGGYLQGEAAAINTSIPPPGSVYVSTLLAF